MCESDRPKSGEGGAPTLFVIPGRAQREPGIQASFSPPVQSLDSGFRPDGRPRNDGVRCGNGAGGVVADCVTLSARSEEAGAAALRAGQARSQGETFP